MGTRHIVYMDLGGLEPAVRNPKEHDLPSLVHSLARYGWTSPAELDERTGKLVVGHGRREACIMLRQAGDPAPGGVIVDDDGEWLVPVLRGWSSRDDTEAEAYIIAHNKLSEAGGWNDRMTAEMVEDVITLDPTLIETLGFTDGFDELLRKVDPESIGDQDPDKPKPTKTTAPDPDPHMALSEGEESVKSGCEVCDRGDLCIQHGSGVIHATDFTGSTTRTHTCPDCGHNFED